MNVTHDRHGKVAGNNIMTEKRPKTNAKTIKVIAFILSTLLLIIIGMSQRQAIYDQLYDWKLTPRPERLTELYFTDHTNLPSTYSVGEKQTVDFTIHNLEYRDAEYSYVITVSSEDGMVQREINGNPFTLVHDEFREISLDFVPVDLGTRSKVTVTLDYDGIAFGEDDPSPQTQSIHYWVERQ